MRTKCHETNYIAIFIFILNLNPLLFHKPYSFLLCKIQTKSVFWFKFHPKIIQISLCLSFYNIKKICIRYENFTLINIFSFPIIESNIFLQIFFRKKYSVLNTFTILFNTLTGNPKLLFFNKKWFDSSLKFISFKR